MKKLSILLAIISTTGCATRKPCQVERICNDHREDMRVMLKSYPETTMDLLHTIAVLENETGHYK